jgi:glycerophosphoryl diester phosphodiesterase
MSALFNTASIAGAIALLAMQSADAKMTEAAYFYRKDRPMIVAHRGSFGHFPEHSIASYTDAYYGGTDYIEMDL